MYIDSHAHFDLIIEDEAVTEDILLKNMSDSAIVNAVQVSIDMDSAHWSHEFSKRHWSSGILFTIGIHPSSKADSSDLELMDGFVDEIMHGNDLNLLFGIGECGLDYYRMRQEKKMQIASFQSQIETANRYNLPLIIHSRDAMEDTIDIIRESCTTVCIMHCFPGDRKAAQKVLDLGMYISFAGNVTYRNAAELHDSAAYVPLERLLLETDAPFLTPVPLRGKKNRTEYIIHTYRFIAELKKISLEQLSEAVNRNFMEIANHEIKKI